MNLMARSASRARLRSIRRRFCRDGRGTAAVEFALIAPILVVLALGCFEVPRYVMVFQKLSRTSSGVADLVAQADDPITTNQMNDIFTAGKLMMQPYDVVANGVIIVSSVNNPGGTGVKITWQKRKGSVATVSKLGVQGATPGAGLPVGVSPASNEEVLVAEVYYNYTPIFGTIIYNGSQIYRASFTRPRNDNLNTSP
jgi:Flp pilus assembly protein TadG